MGRLVGGPVGGDWGSGGLVGGCKRRIGVIVKMQKKSPGRGGGGVEPRIGVIGKCKNKVGVGWEVGSVQGGGRGGCESRI